jgi:tripartite-type tricarboxylate transporter receptor subunit TctC
MKTRHLLLVGMMLATVTPAVAQTPFYQGKVLTLLINYGVGGNADTEARVYQRHLAKHIPGKPDIIIQNVPGAGGFTAMNILGLGVNMKADGLTAGYFTTSAIGPLIDDPALKVKMNDFAIIGAARGWNMIYARKDIVPGGLEKPEDFVKAKSIYLAGYSRSSSHDTRLRLAMEIFNLPYTVVTGFPGTAQINKAMLQNEINLSGSSLPGYMTQVMPQIMQTGIGAPLFQYPVIGKDGSPVGNPALEKYGLEGMDKIYARAFGKAPSGPKWDALLLMSDIGTQMQRGLMLPRGAPKEAIEALRAGFIGLMKDEGFIEDYKKVTSEEPDLVRAEELLPLFERIGRVDPAIKKVLRDSIGNE